MENVNITDTSGFYKLQDESFLLFGPNFVLNKDYELRRESRDRSYPVDGWYWFDSDEQAREFFGLPSLKDQINNQDQTE